MVMVTSTRPGDADGEVAAQLVTVVQLTELAELGPNRTVPDPTMKPVPVMVTTVPPVVGPATGLTVETVGR